MFVNGSWLTLLAAADARLESSLQPVISIFSDNAASPSFPKAC